MRPHEPSVLGCYAKGAARWRTQIQVLRTTIEDVESELYRAIFTLAKHGVTVPPPVRTYRNVVNPTRAFDVGGNGGGSTAGAGAAAAVPSNGGGSNLPPRQWPNMKRRTSAATVAAAAAATAATAFEEARGRLSTDGPPEGGAEESEPGVSGEGPGGRWSRRTSLKHVVGPSLSMTNGMGKPMSGHMETPSAAAPALSSSSHVEPGRKQSEPHMGRRRSHQFGGPNK